MDKNFKEIFTNIYNDKEWGISRDDNTSGTGDIINNLPFFLFIEKFLNLLNIKSILDFGCGDWSLMKYVLLPKNVKYIGLDVVESVIKSNNTKYKKEKNIKFYNIGNNYLEIKKNKKYNAELLLVKNVFENWELEDIQNFLNSILQNFKYALFSCFYNPSGYNANTPVGWFHTLNMLDFKYPESSKIDFLFASEIYDGTYNAYYLCYQGDKNAGNIDINISDLLFPLKNLQSTKIITDIVELDKMILQDSKYAAYPKILNQFRERYNIRKFIWGNNNEIFIYKNQVPLSIMIGSFEYARVIYCKGFNYEPLIKNIERGLFEMKFKGSENIIYLYSFNDDIEKLMPYLLRSQLFNLN